MIKTPQSTLSYEVLMQERNSIKIPTKGELLTEFMKSVGKYWKLHWLIVPEKLRPHLDTFTGEIPEFIKFSKELDSHAFIIRRFPETGGNPGDN